jgi:hypothetical protein
LALCACAARPPVTALTPPPKFPRIEDTVPRWEPFARDEAGGLDYFAGTIRNPPLAFHALRADLAEPSLRIITNGDPARESGPVGHGLIPSTKVSSFVRRYECLAGINTAPFSPVSGREGENRTISGLAIRDGRLISPPQPAFDALIFFKSGVPGPRAAIVRQSALENLDPIANASGGFNIVLEQGRIAARLAGNGEPAPRHPRSAGGLSPGGGVLYLLVIDGRQFASIGATEAETGLLLKQLGASDGINFDGGGSTALALRFGDGKVRVVNTPIHGQIPGRERGVASCLGIAPASGSPTPAP